MRFGFFCLDYENQNIQCALILSILINFHKLNEKKMQYQQSENFNSSKIKFHKKYIFNFRFKKLSFWNVSHQILIILLIIILKTVFENIGLLWKHIFCTEKQRFGPICARPVHTVSRRDQFKSTDVIKTSAAVNANNGSLILLSLSWVSSKFYSYDILCLH